MSDGQTDTATIAPADFTPLGDHQPTPTGGGKPLPWIIGGAVLLFAIALLYLIIARSVEILVEASAPTEYEIDGFGHLSLGQRQLMLTGEYTLRATAEGYHPLETPFMVGDAASQTFTFTLRPLPGIINITTRPEGATVFLDDEQIGRTPLRELSLEPGEQQLRIQSERHLPHEQLMVIEGRAREQSFDIALDPAWAEVTIATNPADAAILVDGEEVARTPAVVEILQGEHQLLLQKPTFASHLQDLEIEAGLPLDLGTIELPPADGLLLLSSTPSAGNVTVNGEFRGQTPLELDLEPGEQHRISVTKPGYRRSTRVMELAAGSSEELKLTLRPQLGEIRVNVQPAGAQVLINGQPRATGSTTLSLPAHEHTLQVSLAGHNSYRQRFTPRPGVEQVINVRLLTEREARMARITPTVTTSLGQTLKLFEPSGSFTMGASRRDPGRRANEVLHPVELTRMFYMGLMEVTNEQFRQFQADHTSGQAQGNSLNREKQPVVSISWQQAAQFCNWLSEKEGLPPFYRQSEGIVVGYNPGATGYRLPTEAEWAWAARVQGDNLRKFTWGEEFPPKTVVENYADTTSAYVTGRFLQGYKDGFVTTAPVGTFKANHNGLFDMGGNVGEWVHDVYTIQTAGSEPLVDPLGPASGDNYVIRGAGWSHSRISELRLSFRDYGQAGRDDVGFRIARFAE